MCTPDHDAIYKIIKSFINKDSLRKMTPDWEDSERINAYWLWAVTNYHKFDPERGNLEQWLKGSCRRILDIYRTEKWSSKSIKEWQYPEVVGENGEPQNYYNMIPDHRETSSLDNEEVQEVVQALDILSDDNKWILTRGILGSGRNGGDKGIAHTLGVDLRAIHTRRCYSKKAVKEHLRKKLDGH